MPGFVPLPTPVVPAPSVPTCRISNWPPFACLTRLVANSMAINPALPVGWHIWHNNSFNPIYRAEQDLQEISKKEEMVEILKLN